MPRRAPQRPGETLRAAVLDRYELEPNEVVLLDAAARTADIVEALQLVVDREGVMVDGRPHPAAVEARMQRLTLGRLLAGLRLPVPDDDERVHQPRRGPRGFYGPRSVS